MQIARYGSGAGEGSMADYRVVVVWTATGCVCALMIIEALWLWPSPKSLVFAIESLVQ